MAMKSQMLTIMFTDIKGFTERTSASTREDLRGLLKKHEDMIKPIIFQIGGNLVKTIGDAFLVTFDSPTDAVLCGILIQNTLMKHNAEVEEGERVEVRIAINSGEVEVSAEGDVFGETVNLTSRIEGITEPNQIYFTESVYLAMNKREVPTSEIGWHRLKGVPEAVKVYRVIQDRESEPFQRLIERLEEGRYFGAQRETGARHWLWGLVAFPVVIALVLLYLLVYLPYQEGREEANLKAIHKELGGLGIQYSRASFLTAIKEGDTYVVELFLDAGMRPNEKDKDDITALIHAARGGYSNIVQALLDKGADVNAQDNEGSTALMYAAVSGYTDIVQVLLDKGADLNAQDKDSRTALMDAVLNDHTETVKALLANGADVNTTNIYGLAALMYAAGKGNTEVVQALIDKGADVSAQDNKGSTALMYAAGKGNTEVVKALLDKGADVNVQEGDGRTALMYAIEGNRPGSFIWMMLPWSLGGHTDTVEVLLAKGAGVNAQNEERWTALIYAAKRGYVKIVQTLLAKDADVNIQERDSQTALMYAAVNGHTDIVRALLDKDADVNVKDKDGKTALMYAIEEGYADIVTLLKKASAK